MTSMVFEICKECIRRILRYLNGSGVLRYLLGKSYELTRLLIELLEMRYLLSTMDFLSFLNNEGILYVYFKFYTFMLFLLAMESSAVLPIAYTA